MAHSRIHPALPWGAALLVAGWMLGSVPAAAHDQVIETSPGTGETVSENPVNITITTSGELLDLGGNSAGFAIIVEDQAGRFYGDGCVSVDGISLSTSAELGDSGPYTVTYQYVSGDGHTLSGDYEFAFERPDNYLPAAGQSQAPVCGEAPVYPPESTTSQPSVTEEPVTGEEDVPPATPAEFAEDDNPWWGNATIVMSVIIPLALGTAAVYWFARRKARS